MIPTGGVKTLENVIRILQCVVRHANASSILLEDPLTARYCNLTSLQTCTADVLGVLGINSTSAINQFLTCNTKVFVYVMCQGHSGQRILDVFNKVEFDLTRVPLFLRQTSNHILEIVIHQSSIITTMKTKWNLSQKQVEDIMINSSSLQTKFLTRYQRVLRRRSIH